MTPSHKGIGRILDAHDFLGRDSGMCASGEFWTHARSSGGIRTYSRPILAKCRPKSIAASEPRPKIGGVQIPPDNALGAQMSPEPFTAHEFRPEATGTRRQPSSRMQFRQGNLDRATRTGQLKQTAPLPLRYRKCYSQLHWPLTNTGTSLPSGMMPVILRSSAPIMKSTWVVEVFTPHARNSSGVIS